MNLSPLPVQKFFDNNGHPLVGGKLFTYVAGTSTKQPTYTNSAGSQVNTNPIILNYRGEANVWLDPDLSYKFVLSDRDDSDPPTRPIWTVDNIPGAPVLSQADFDALLAASLPYRRTAREIAKGIIPAVYLYPEGDLRRYGGIGNGLTDDSSAWQQAVSLGLAIIPEGYSFLVNSPAAVTGTLCVYGFGTQSKLLCDSSILTVTAGTDSVLDNFCMENVTAPWIITRDPNNWAFNPLPTLQQSNTVLGYQPTANDADIYASLTSAQKFDQIGPYVEFTGNASNVQISRIYGRFITINLKGVVRSTVRDCAFRGGKNFLSAAAIYFDGHTPNQRGSGNAAYNNSISYASFCGIAFNENDDFASEGNLTYRCGESGIKTQQFDGTHPTDISFRGSFVGNKAYENYYDGMDLLSIFPQVAGGLSDTNYTCHSATGNHCRNNGGVGMSGDGRMNVYVGNTFSENYQSGFWGYGVSQSQVSNNLCQDNNRVRSASNAEMIVNGVAGMNSITGNSIFSGAGQNGPAIAQNLGNNTASNYTANNYAVGSVFYWGNEGVQPSMEYNNVDTNTVTLTDQSFVLNIFNNAGTLQHAFWGDTQNADIGFSLSRVHGASATYTNTPSGADSSTAFAAGGKIGSGSTSTFWVDTNAQVAAYSQGICAISNNTTGTAMVVKVGYQSVNINGVTRVRLCFQLYNASAGAVAITTANIPGGAVVQIQFYGKLA